MRWDVVVLCVLSWQLLTNALDENIKSLKNNNIFKFLCEDCVPLNLVVLYLALHKKLHYHFGVAGAN